MDFVREIQDDGGIEKVRVNLITSWCNCGTDPTDFLFQDMDKEIPLVNETEFDDSLSQMSALYEEVRFIDIQSKVLPEVKNILTSFCSVSEPLDEEEIQEV